MKIFEYIISADITAVWSVYEAPLNVEEYVAMRDGPTIRFDYEDYASIFWTLDTDEVIVGFMPEE